MIQSDARSRRVFPLVNARSIVRCSLFLGTAPIFVHIEVFVADRWTRIKMEELERFTIEH